nr:putative calcium-transporting ATPase 11, plasma membrane-type [Tanacetum cinerariifolium]
EYSGNDFPMTLQLQLEKVRIERTIFGMKMAEGKPENDSVSNIELKELLRSIMLYKNCSLREHDSTTGGFEDGISEDAQTEHALLALTLSWCICDKTKTLTSNHMYIIKCIGSEVVKDKDGQTSVLGTPMESAILEYDLSLGGDFGIVRCEEKVLKMEPFNSKRKKMSVITTLPDGTTRVFCKGASKIVLGLCDKIINANGETV